MNFSWLPWWVRVLVWLPAWARRPLFKLIKWYCVHNLTLLERPAQQQIGGDYLHRWWIRRDREKGNTYFHKIMRSDDDRALHDHPWDFVSLILEGGYIELRTHLFHGGPVINVRYEAGDVNVKKAEDAHRLILYPDTTAYTLVFTSPVRRAWGFYCRKGWVPWEQFVNPNNSDLVGPGCGE